MTKYDAIIIGTGQAGVPLAIRLAGVGWKTALIERALTGGTCINYGCTPTKTMIASARVAYLARRGKEFGVPAGDFNVDLKTVVSRKNAIVAQLHDSTQMQLENTTNLDFMFGEASFTAEKTVSVSLNDGGKQELAAEYIFINTGGRTAVPKIDGLGTVDYLTSTTILDLEEIPKHLLIIGGSYIGLEFGQMFRRFGSEVTVLDSAPRFLAKEDEDVANELRKILEEDGITIYAGATVEQIQKPSPMTVRAIINKEVKPIQCSHILIAAGRTPNTDRLNLPIAGIKTDVRGYIVVDDKLETSVKGVYALGDVKGGPAFTHISYNDHLVIVKNLLEKGNISIKDRPAPYCMFTDPELGRIGLTEQQARAQGYKIKVPTLPMTFVRRATETSETRGVMKAVVDANSGKILGVAVLGMGGGEIMTVMQMAMAGGITYMELRDTIFAHPLWSESINNLFMTLDEN